MNIAFVGLGNFGYPIAQNLTEKSHCVVPLVFQGHSQTRAEELRRLNDGRKLPALEDCDALVLCLPRSEDVEEVLAAYDGQLPKLIIDLSTSRPHVSKRLAEHLNQSQTRFIDAPLSGSIAHARAGKLTVFAGCRRGESETADRILADIGDKVFYFDAAGHGNIAKLINQIVHLTNMAIIGEAFSLVSSLGLSLESVYQALRVSSANSVMLERFGPDIVNGDYSPKFALRLAKKDLEYAVGLMDGGPGAESLLSKVKEVFQQADAKGCGDRNISAIYTYFCGELNQRASKPS